MIKYLKYLKAKKTIEQSGYFDKAYYLFTYSDIRLNDMEPIEHYLYYGAKEGRNPSEFFDTQWYLQTYQDVQVEKINPLLHYILHGEKENRNPNPNFDTKWYLEAYNDVKTSMTPPLKHYILHGRQEGRTTCLSQTLLSIPTDSLEVEQKHGSINQAYVNMQKRMKLQESYLIDWQQERQKARKSNFASIIIPLYGQATLTDNCLESLFASDAAYPFEVILINNSQNQNDIAALKKWESNPSIKIVHNEENYNFALGCNQGFSHSIGEQVVFLNNDTLVTDEWLRELLKPLEDENISSVQPKLLYPDGALQCMGIVFSNQSDIAYPIYQNEEVSRDILNKSRKFQAVTAACLALRAQDFALIEGFDTSFVNGQEDIDLCLRLNRLKNSMSYYCANVTLYHYEGKSQGRGRFVAQNRRNFLERWRGKITADDHFYYAQDGYEVIYYQLDNENYQKLGLEFYTPALQESQIEVDTASKHPRENTLFCIETQHKKKSGQPTIMLSTHVLSKVLYGGQRSFLDMVEALFSTHYNVIVTIPNSSNLEYIDMLSAFCHKIYVVGYTFWSAKGFNDNAINLLENIIYNNSVDALYVNTIVCKEPLFAAQQAKIPRIIHVREIIDHDDSLRKTIGIDDAQTIIEEVKESAELLICNSQATLKIFDSPKSVLIYNRVDMHELESLQPRNTPILRFAIISGNEPKKGIFDFVKVAQACQNIDNIEFCMIGHRNSHIKAIEKDIKDSKLNNLKILGYFNTSYQAINECDVVMSLSHFQESFGRTVAEAMAARKVVIGYNWGAISELIDDGKTGFICEYKNLDEVIDKVKYIANHRDLLPNMGEKGHTKIKSLCDLEIYNRQIDTAMKQALTQTLSRKSEIEITIIIPIYNAYDEVINCIDSVLNTVTNCCEILLINDASSDERITPLLEKYNAIANISIYHNASNIGYTKNINKAIKLAKGKDIILLNSDTIVTTGWVETLQKVAYSQSTIGTVTAMSDNAGAFSFPSNPKGVLTKPKRMTHNHYAQRIIEQTHSLEPIEVPTGSGFCLYIKRELIDAIGLFDEQLFPRGYGEENDFCMRAIEAGWINLISTSTFVFHRRTASFKDQKKLLVKEAQSKLRSKYPNYSSIVQDAFHSPQMQKLQQYANHALKYIHETNPLSLHQLDTLKEQVTQNYLKIPDKQPSVSIIVIVENEYTHIQPLFETLYDNTLYTNFEIIIFANSSKVNSDHIVEQNNYDFKLKIIADTQQHSFAYATYQAAQQANGEYLLFLDPEMEPLKGWLSHLVSAITTNTNVAAVGAQILYPHYVNNATKIKVYHTGIAFNHEIMDGLECFMPYHIGLDKTPIIKSDRAIIGARIALSSGAMLVDKKIFLEVGGFTEVYCDDTQDADFGLKLQQKGYRSLYCQNAMLFYHQTKKPKFTDFIEPFRSQWYAYLYPQYFFEKFRGKQKTISNRKLRVAFAVTQAGEEVAAGDYFTALELSDAFKSMGYEICFLERLGGNWYQVSNEIDVVISMLDSYDLHKLKNKTKNFITIAWIRNWPDRWLANPSFDQYSMIFASSQTMCDMVKEQSGRDALLFPIATTPEKFIKADHQDDYFRSDYSFTGSYWGVPRDIESILNPAQLEYKFSIYGKNWDQIEKFKPYDRGFLNYRDIPKVYANSKITIDDAAISTKPYGSVNSRVFDAIAGGTLVLTNGVIGAQETFGELLPTYESAEELEALLNLYLSNDRLREERIKKLRHIVFNHHTYRIRAQYLKRILESFAGMKPSIAIKIPVPHWNEAKNWGDYHLALGLQKQFIILGYHCIVQILPEWYNVEGDRCDVVLVLRGLSKYQPKKHQLNLMWNISHPDKVSDEEYNSYDKVFVASDIWAQKLKERVSTEIEVMHQCSDPELFKPYKEDTFVHQLLFVGNSRKIYRKALEYLLPTDYELAVYGRHWEELIDSKYIKGQYINNHEVYKYYSSADIVLNDHWESMRENGFISNRIFDVLACNGFILSDDVKGLKELFGDSIITYRSKEDLQNKIEYYLTHKQEREALSQIGRKLVLEKHTHKNRVEQILKTIQANIETNH